MKFSIAIIISTLMTAQPLWAVELTDFDLTNAEAQSEERVSIHSVALSPGEKMRTQRMLNEANRRSITTPEEAQQLMTRYNVSKEALIMAFYDNGAFTEKQANKVLNGDIIDGIEVTAAIWTVGIILLVGAFGAATNFGAGSNDSDIPLQQNRKQKSDCYTIDQCQWNKTVDAIVSGSKQ